MERRSSGDERFKERVDYIGTIENNIQMGKADHKDRITNKGGVPNKFGLEDIMPPIPFVAPR